MAAPLVSGVAALAFAVDPDADWQTVKNAILSGVDPVNDLKGECVTGGRLNANNAVNAMSSGTVSVFGDINGSDTNDVIEVRLNPLDSSELQVVFHEGVNETVWYRGAVSSIPGVVVYGLYGNDEITVDSAVTVPVTLRGGDGDDTLCGGGAGIVMSGGGGDNSLVGTSGNDTLWGGTGDDTLVGGGGDDWMNGGPHDNSMLGGSGNDTLEGGFHEIDTLWTSDSSDFLDGGAGDNLLVGGMGNNTLFGGAGDDCILGGNGDNLLVGGTGTEHDVGRGRSGRGEL